MSSVNSPTTLLTAPFHRDLGGNIANYESSQKPMAGGRKSNKKSKTTKRKTTKRKTTKRKAIKRKATKRKATKRLFGLF